MVPEFSVPVALSFTWRDSSLVPKVGWQLLEFQGAGGHPGEERNRRRGWPQEVVDMFTTILNDIRRALRTLLKSPAFIVAIVMGVFPSDGRGQVVELASEVEAREIAFAKTMADRDLEAFLTFVSPEAVFFAGNDPLRGRDAIAQGWAPFFEGAAAPFSWHPDVVEVLESGRLALSSGLVRGPSGEEVGRFNSIWRKGEDGQWRVVFDKGS